MDIVEAIQLLLGNALGVLWFVGSFLFFAIGFPALLVVFLCFVDWKIREFRHPVPLFLISIIFSSAWSAVGFRIDRARLLHDTDWLVFILGFVAGCALWLLYSCKMDTIRAPRPLRDRTLHKPGRVEPELE